MGFVTRAIAGMERLRHEDSFKSFPNRKSWWVTEIASVLVTKGTGESGKKSNKKKEAREPEPEQQPEQQQQQPKSKRRREQQRRHQQEDRQVETRVSEIEQQEAKKDWEATSAIRKEVLIERFLRQTCEQQVALQNSLWTQQFLVCWLQYHYQQLLLAYRVQQYLLNFLFQQQQHSHVVPTTMPGDRESSTSSGPMTTPITSPPVMPMMVMHPLPLRGAPGAPPTFDGRNATSFLRRFESMCDNYQVQTPARLKRILEYCDDDVAREVECFSAWVSKDWEALKGEMLREWRKEDTEQLMYTRAFLEEYVSKPRSKDSLKHYYRQYDRIAKVLVLKDELDSYSQGRLFINGLPEGIRHKVLSKQELSSHAPIGSINYQKALNSVKKIIDKDKMMEQFVLAPERQTDISSLAESLNFVKQPTAESQVRFSTTAEEKNKEDTIKLITKGFNALTLPLTAAINKLEAASATKPPASQQALTGLNPALEGNRQGRPAGSSFIYYTCEKPGHTKPYCPDIQRLIREGLIHINGDKRFCLGPAREGAAPIWKVTGMTMLQSIERQLNMRNAPTGAGFGCIKADVDEDSDEEVAEDWYGQGAAVDASRAEIQGKGKRVAGRLPVTDPVRDARTRATKHTAQKENAYPIMKNLRTGVWVPEEGEPSATAGTSSQAQREDTLEMEVVSEAAPEVQNPAKANPKVAKTSLKKLLAGHTNPLSIIDRILQQPLTISWAEALSLSGDLRKFMFGTFADPKVTNDQPMDAQISKMAAKIKEEAEHAYEVLEKAADPLYIAASPMAKVTIVNKEMTALVDSGAEVTVMTKDLAWSLGLPMTQSINVNMFPATGKSRRFIGLCEEVPISIGKITHKVPVWVIDKLEHGLILGRPYHRVAGLKNEDMADGSCHTTIWNPDRSAMVRWQSVAADAKRNQTRSDLLRKNALNFQAEA